MVFSVAQNTEAVLALAGVIVTLVSLLGWVLRWALLRISDQRKPPGDE